jgi:hypothetical protein
MALLWFLVLVLAAVVVGVGVASVQIVRAASRQESLRERLAHGADVGFAGQPEATVAHRRGEAEDVSGDSEERVDGYYTTNFFI